jgi:hypothetical protein
MVQTVASLPPQRLGFDSGPFHVRFLVDKVRLGNDIFPSTSVVPCRYNSTNVALSSSLP